MAISMCGSLRVVFLYGSAEGRPVVGHRLREFKQLGSQALGAAKCDPQFPGPQRNAGGKILEEALAYIWAPSTFETPSLALRTALQVRIGLREP